MKAVIAIGGRQYQVENNSQLTITGVAEGEGKTISVPVHLLWNENSRKIASESKPIQAILKVVKVEKGEKVDTRRFKNKVRHRRHTGLRKVQTTLVVEKFTHLDQKGKAVELKV